MNVCVYIYIYICIHIVHINKQKAVGSTTSITATTTQTTHSLPGCATRGDRKGTNGVSAKGVFANLVTPVNLALSSQKFQGVPFFPNLSKIITIMQRPPLVLTTFVRNQGDLGVGPGVPCKFPFTYEGREYNRCQSK